MKRNFGVFSCSFYSCDRRSACVKLKLNQNIWETIVKLYSPHYMKNQSSYHFFFSTTNWLPVWGTLSGIISKFLTTINNFCSIQLLPTGLPPFALNLYSTLHSSDFFQPYRIFCVNTFLVIKTLLNFNIYLRSLIYVSMIALLIKHKANLAHVLMNLLWIVWFTNFISLNKLPTYIEINAMFEKYVVFVCSLFSFILLYWWFFFHFFSMLCRDQRSEKE